jgi:hypothetical protein
MAFAAQENILECKNNVSPNVYIYIYIYIYIFLDIVSRPKVLSEKGAEKKFLTKWKSQEIIKRKKLHFEEFYNFFNVAFTN